MNYKHMGDLISELRKQQNMTQKDLADKLNVTDKAVSKWERGICLPDISSIPQLAQILNISSEELLNIQKDTANETRKPSYSTLHEKVRTISILIFKAVGMAMGVGVLVLSILNEIETSSAITLLAVGIISIGLALFSDK